MNKYDDDDDDDDESYDDDDVYIGDAIGDCQRGGVGLQGALQVNLQIILISHQIILKFWQIILKSNQMISNLTYR